MGSSSGNDNDAESGPSFFGSMAEDLGNIFSGTVPGIEVDGKISYAHSAYDVRNANARAADKNYDPVKKRTLTAKDYLRGGEYGPGGGKYSPSDLHQAGLNASRAKNAASGSTRGGGKASRATAREGQAQGTAALTEGKALTDDQATAQTVEAENQGKHLTTQKAPQAPVKGISLSEDQPTHRNALATQTKAQVAQTASTAKPAPTHVSTDQQMSNLRQHNLNKAKAEKPAVSSSGRVHNYLSEISKAQYQPGTRPATMTAAAARKAAWSAVKAREQPAQRTQDQKAADVGEQPAQTMTGSVGVHGPNAPADVAKVQNDLVQAGAMDSKYATGFIGTANIDAIKGVQKAAGLTVDGTINPGGPTEAEVAKNIKAAKPQTVTPEQSVANQSTSLKDGRIKAWQNVMKKPGYKLGTRPDNMTAAEARKAAWDAVKSAERALNLGGAKPDGQQAQPKTPKMHAQPSEVDKQNTIYGRTVNNQAPGFRNDGFIGQVMTGTNGIAWNDKPDDNVHMGSNTIHNSVTLDVDGPFRVEPNSATFGADSAWVSVDWHQRNGNVTPEFRSNDLETRQHLFSSAYGQAGFYDFAPPYSDSDAKGYRVTITKSAQPDNSGASLGTKFNIYSRKGDKSVKRNIK